MLYTDYQYFIIRCVENRKIFFANYVGNRKMFIFLYKTKNLRTQKSPFPARRFLIMNCAL